MRVGMAQQQYQRLEAAGNPSLNNLALVAKGLQQELLLIPQEKLQAVKAILEGRSNVDSTSNTSNLLTDNPWQNLFTEDK